MKLYNLSSESNNHLQERRDYIESLLASESEEHHTAAEKLTLLNLLFKKRPFNNDPTFLIESMGVLLGDALCQVLNLNWVMVEDGDIFSPAVAYSNSTIVSFPIDVIIKRVNQHEDIDIFYLFICIAETMSKMLKSGEYSDI